MCITVVMTGDLHAVSHPATTGTNVRLTTPIERYFADLGWVQASSEATGGRSSYGPLAHLPNVVGAALKPKVFRVGEPIDLAWSLASYARDGLARVEAAGDSSSLWAARTALEEALDGRFECREGARFLRSPPMPTLFYGVFSVSMLRARQLPLPAGGFDKRMAVRHLRAGARGAAPAALRSGPLATARSGEGVGLDGGGSRSGGPDRLFLAGQRGRACALLLRAVPRGLRLRATQTARCLVRASLSFVSSRTDGGG